MAIGRSLLQKCMVYAEDPSVLNLFESMGHRDGDLYELRFKFLTSFTKLQVVVKASDVYPKDAEAPPCGVDDMTKLAYLHEPGVLQNLRSRYDMNEIYVSIF